jgi:F-box/leucine-rich repeat protein 2/20
MNSLGSYITPSQKKCTVLKKYEYHEEKVEFPEDILYKDTLCLFPQEKLTLDKWTLPKTAFETLRKDFSQHLMSLSLDRAQGVTSSRLDVFPSLKNINILHLKGTITIDVPTATLIGRLSRVYELDISENIVLEKSFHHIFSRLDMLKYLYCNKCKGIDDFALQTIANNVSKFRKLSHIYMSENHDYSDEGMLALITVGPGIIIELDISGSNSLTTLSMAGVRRQMTSLRMLNISCIRGSGQSSYEFIAEGCVFLTELDVHKSSTLDDAALTLIGRKCSILRKLNISDCINVSDVGVESFVSEFQGQLQSINISGCIKCGGPSAFALSTISKKITSIRMNCLSMVTKASMKALWKKLPTLEEFEMSADIRR